MNAREIINAVADDADDFLAGVSSMTEARTAIREYLKSHHPTLAATDEPRVVAGVLAILEEEGFFAGGGDGDTLSEEAAGGGSDDEP